MAGPTLPELKAKVAELETAVDLEQQQVKDALEAKDAAIAERDAAIVERDAAIVEKDAVIAQRDATIAELNAVIAELQLLVADGGTPEERQAVLDHLNTIKADVESTLTP